MAILLTTVLLYFLTLLSNDQRRASYDIELAQESQDRALEKIVAANTGLIDDPPGFPPGKYMNSVIKNDGSLSTVVSYSVLYCTDGTCPIDPVEDNSAITLNAKETAARIMGPVNPGNSYRVDFITERGNIFYTQDCLVGVTEIQCSDGIGTPDFALSSSPSTIFILPGESETSEITVTSLFGFSGDVDLTVDSPAGVTASVLPASVLLTSDDFATATLSFDTEDTITTGTYVLTVTGASGVISHTTDVTIVVFTTGAEGEDPEFDDEILKPQIQGVFPSPHGETGSSSSKEGLWGAIVANPSDATMTVRRVVITAFTPYGTNPNIFPSSGGSPYCPVTNVLPAAGGTWTCPARNTLAWSGTLTIPAHSSQEFFATVGKPSSNENFPSYAINFNVFTNFGQYAKAGYSGSMTSSESEIANVYLSTALESTSRATMIGKLTVASGNTVTARATIAHLGDVGQINAGTKVIVAIPKAFTNVQLTTDPPNGFSPCTVSNLGDGSTQISCPLSAALTAGQARTVEFEMDAPVISGTTAKLYQLLVLADGTDGNAAPMGAVGPVSENVVVVTPT